MCDTCGVAQTAVGRPLTNAQRREVNALRPIDYVTNATYRRDPTRTAQLRGRYVADMRRRFGVVRGAVNETVGRNNALRINAAAKAFEFTNDPGRIAEFMDWLRQEINSSVLDIAVSDGRPPVNGWQKVYVREAYGRGVEAANALMKQSGITIPTTALGGDVPIGSIFRLPIHQDTLELLYTRQFEDLRGVTREMSTQMSRVLADGLATGKNNRAIAKALVDRVDKIGIVRSEMIVRTEIIRTHAEATLNRLEEMGATMVTPLVEFGAAADACPICKELEGKVYTIAEARGIIPVHVNCRCVWIPVLRK